MAQRVLVLGAAGFIGRRIVARLAAEGAVPVAGLRRPQAIAGAAEQRQVEATDSASIAAALDGIDAIVNSVAGDPATLVGNAQALAAALAARRDPPLLVHLSTMAVFGSATGVVDETAPVGTGLTPYGAAKLEAERLLAPLPRRVLLRPGLVYGPGSAEWSGLIGRLLLQRRLGDLGAAGAGGCNLVHVDDVAAAVAAALRVPAAQGRCFHLAQSPVPDWNAYFRAYGAALGVAVPAIGTARLALELRLIGPLLKIGERLGLRLLPAIRPWLTEQCRQPLWLDAQAAESVLGLHWKPLAEGLRESADWLLAAQAAR